MIVMQQKHTYLHTLPSRAYRSAASFTKSRVFLYFPCMYCCTPNECSHFRGLQVEHLFLWRSASDIVFTPFFRHRNEKNTEPRPTP